MTKAGYLLLGLTAIVAALAGILAFAVAKFFAAARATARASRLGGSETAFMAAAMQEALQQMRTQERAMKARAEASERLSGEIISSMTSGLLVVNEEGVVRTLNPAGQRLLGLPDGNWTTNHREVLTGSTSLADVIDECLSAKRPIVRRAVKMDRPGAGASHLGITVSPIRDGTGFAHGAICLFTDISEVIDLEDQLRLKDSLARLGELTAGIAHEFRNGLATIHGYSRLLDPEALPVQYRPYVEGIRQETEVLGKVVTNFLNFARPEHVSFAPADLETIARRAADDLRHDLPDETTIAINGDFAQIQGDEVLLRQVFGNLLRNAAEACETAGVTPAISIQGQVDRAARLCRVSVDDNGPGIAEEVRDRVFRPFFTTRSRGTGLGLAIVQKIVLTHDGRVAIGTGPAGGASIELTFRLPPG
jgi:nitrogen fixation/metabolism regulation signal transduction histidine kinase